MLLRLEEKISSNVLHRQLGGAPARAVAAKGVYIFTEEGRAILDGSGGAAVSCIGHSNAEVIEAIAKQASELAYAHTGFFTSRPAEELADLLVGDRPGGLVRAAFVAGGSEGVEASLKLARQYFVEIGEPDRTHFISRRQSYHGATLGALALGHNRGRRDLHLPLLSDCFSHVSAANAYRDQRDCEPESAYVERLIAEIEGQFERIGPRRVIAFVAEPVVGATSGAVPAPAGYFPRVREICDRHGALLILDEIMCGMGRIGSQHAWQQIGVVPDIEIVAKGLAGGYQPIGAVLVSDKVMRAFERSGSAFQHGHTYMAHPIACAAALTVQSIIRRDKLIERVRTLGDRLEAGLRTALGQHPHVGDIRGRGLLQGVEIVKDRDSKEPFNPALNVHARLKAAAMERGLACYPSGGTADGLLGDHVLLAPPFISEFEHIDLIVEILADSIDSVTRSIDEIS